ncbi:lipopolysaccharide transport system ATP-binding protein [Yersinia aldovae]|uniref:ABC transporter ATP-binding protein n=1 Tax=Yersinia aldovae TaxID=29483 RepID=UPI0005DCBF6A|nr:ABC transporter ATP-binding protein [Yersinia aldovae]CNJ46231.1 lipopolysaccharide transport system ATP-binding protein [Yersinia aldovae]
MHSVYVEKLGKAYKQYPSRWGRLIEWIYPNGKKRHNLKWILKNVNFTVDPGEAVGIIGVNGAGKSTLLKMITGTTQPTVGTVSVIGRVAAMLELGMGFHPEFTGRQNVYMAGQLLGLTIEELTYLMPEIESFAEIGSYIDQPVRVYSSGMQVRLAFSVATIVRPALLIVDEAMSVGDVYFQQKCIERIEKFKREGTSILFVTHDFSALHTICDKAILLADGECQFIGRTVDAVELYYGYLNKNKAIASTETEIGQKYIGIQKFIKKISLKSESANVVSCIENETECCFEIELQGLHEFDSPHIGFRIQDRLGQVIYETNTFCQKINMPSTSNINRVYFKFYNNLCPGEYTLAMGIEAGGHGDGMFNMVIALTERVTSFQVIDRPTANKWAGLTNLNPKITVE